MKKRIIAVGMSGGVDSSVSALLLKKAGHEVFGLFMKNWEEKDGSCNSTQDFDDVAKVCSTLDIPYYTLNFCKEYRETVFSKFLEGYKKGATPNPDILCNREIKFNLFLKKAKELGADFLATGHYAQKEEKEGLFSLLKGNDSEKDQSYFLYTLNQEILRNVLFPIGHLKKSEVRQLAKEHSLSTATKKDSVGICFIGKREFRPFLGGFLGFSPGVFETLEGQVVGHHEGASLFTIGQRKGLAIGGKGEAWYVVGKDMSRNVVIVAQGENHPALFSNCLQASELSWIEGSIPSLPHKCNAKVRYRQKDQCCTIESLHQELATISFSDPQRAVTELQSIVFYEGQKCLGGGIIQKVDSKLF
jgi:tRNA-uridine 2-sulfurtransferase